jgi:hypothetical protein
MRGIRKKQKSHDALQVVKRALPSAACDPAFDDGEEFICRNCDVPEKPCVEDPLYECVDKILAGTQLESARDRFRSMRNDEFPRCESCGMRLSAAQLRNEPFTELCPSCLGDIRSSETCSGSEKPGAEQMERIH